MVKKAGRRSHSKTKKALIGNNRGGLALRRAAKFNPKIMAVVMVLAIGVGSVLLFGRASGPNAVVANGRFGMNTFSVLNRDPAVSSAAYDQLKSIGVDWVRVEFEWDAIEGNRGSFDWQKTDNAVSQAVAHSVNVLAVIDYTPAWARTNQSSDKYPPDDPQTYATFASQVVAHYKNQVHYWEIWNEPNNAVFWQPKPDPGAYTALLSDAYASIKRADPGATVISGGLSPNSGNFDPRYFLASMYSKHGGTSSGLFDAVGWHPYCGWADVSKATMPDCTWYQMFGTNPSARSIMGDHGDSGKLIWPTEYGVCTGGTGGQATNLTTQAADVTDAYNAAGKISWLGPVFWYNLQDSSNNPNDFFFDFCGLLDYNGNPKPSWAAYKAVAKTIDTTPPTDVALTSPATGSAVGGTVTFKATAKDNVGVTQVVVYGDGAQLGTATYNSGQYSFNWNSAAFSDGSHTFYVKAYDAAGNLTVSHTITLAVDNTPPNTVAIFTPADGAVVSGKHVVFGASAKDNVAVAKVRYTLDGNFLGFATLTPYGYTYPWDSTTVPNGTHTFRVKAIDTAGNVTISDPVRVIVSN